MILTRFSRVTFNAAHKYLGLTTEVLRTEKAINDIACHPLPASFYEGGGLQYLRQRFDGKANQDVSSDKDYFSYMSPTMEPSKSPQGPILPKANQTDSPLQLKTPFRTPTSRHEVQAGDLHSSATHSDVYRPLTRTFSVLNTPLISRKTVSKDGILGGNAAQLSKDEFDLRDEVMSCIAKSIGLLQPPPSAAESVETSPTFSATEGPGGRPQSNSYSSFGSLSLLSLNDDASSMTGGSASVKNGGYMSGLDNEVEILFFAAGSTLAKAGESHTG